MGIDAPEKRYRHYPYEFSGGMLQRVMIAMALALKPALLIADEPTTALDVTIKAQIVQELKDAVSRTNTSLLLISHDLGITAHLCDRVAVMHGGRTAMQQREKKILLTVKDLKLHYNRGLFSRQIVRAVNGVSFTIGHGETVGLIGESGSGKSTLARCILRLIKPTSGRIWFEGNDISRMNDNLKSFRRKVQVIFQDADGALNPRMRTIDLVSEPLRIHGLPKDKAHLQALNLLKRVKLSPDLAESFPAELSGGQRQRIGIARALSLSPQLIIADEATASLDILNRVHIVNLLRQLQAESGISYLFISHDINLIRRMADQVAVMHRGKFVEAGPVDRIFSAPAHPYRRELLSSNRSLDPLSDINGR